MCRDCGCRPVAILPMPPFLFGGRWVYGRPASRCARCLELHRIREKRGVPSNVVWRNTGDVALRLALSHDF
jgi:hypothetical protein